MCAHGAKKSRRGERSSLAALSLSYSWTNPGDCLGLGAGTVVLHGISLVETEAFISLGANCADSIFTRTLRFCIYISGEPYLDELCGLFHTQMDNVVSVIN